MSGNVNVQLAMEQQESVEFEGSTSGGTVFEEASSCRISDSQDVEIDFTEISEEKIRWETLSSEDLYRKMLVLTGEVSSIVGARRDDLMGMLIAYKWDAERFQEEWFSEPERVRSRLGLGEGVKDAETQCQICFDRFETETDMLGCGCGHSMCRECWKQYVHSKVEDGASSLDIRCPVYKCGRRAPAALVEGPCLARTWTGETASYRKFCRETFRYSVVPWCRLRAGGEAFWWLWPANRCVLRWVPYRILLSMYGGRSQASGLSGCEVLESKNDKESLNMVVSGQHKGMSWVQQAHTEESWVHAHDVLSMQTRVLLALLGGLEEAFVHDGWVLFV
eukprot:jgi/Picre1/29541/NNA_004927.t1